WFCNTKQECIPHLSRITYHCGSNMTIDRRLVGTVLSEMLGIGALAMLFYYLDVSGAASISDAWAVDRAVAYLLLFAGPLLIFLPLAALLRLGPLTLLGA